MTIGERIKKLQTESMSLSHGTDTEDMFMLAHKKCMAFPLVRSAALILIATLFPALFACCQNEAAPTDIPFYYMIFTVSNGYSGVMGVPDEAVFGAPYHRVVISSEEELHSDIIYQATEVSQGYSFAMLEYSSERISMIMANRYTKEYFDSHDLLIFYIEEGGGSIYHDVNSLQMLQGKTTMLLRSYAPINGSDERNRIRLTLTEVPKGYFSKDGEFPEIVMQEIWPEDPLYAGFEEAKYHHFPEGIMEDIHEWVPME